MIVFSPISNYLKQNTAFRSKPSSNLSFKSSRFETEEDVFISNSNKAVEKEKRHDAISMYMNELRKSRRYPKEEIQALLKQVEQGGELAQEAKTKIMESYLPYITFFAKRFAKKDEEKFLEFIQTGVLELNKLVTNYASEPEKFNMNLAQALQVKFIREQHKMDSLLNIKQSDDDARIKVRNFITKFYFENMRYPTEEEIAETLKMSTNKVLSLIKLDSRPIYLDEKLNENSKTTFSEIIADKKDPKTFRILELNLTSEDLEKALNNLRPYHRNYIKARYGLEDGIPKTLSETAKELDLDNNSIKMKSLTKNSINLLRKEVLKQVDRNNNNPEYTELAFNENRMNIKNELIENIRKKGIKLTEFEFKILSLLLQKPGQWVEFETFSQQGVDSNRIREHMRNLRKKIKLASDETLDLQALIYYGYKIELTQNSPNKKEMSIDKETDRNIFLDEENLTAKIGDKTISFFPIDFAIFKSLCENMGNLVKNEDIAETLQQIQPNINKKQITSHAQKIKTKIENIYGNTLTLKNIYGQGYILQFDEEKPAPEATPVVFNNGIIATPLPETNNLLINDKIIHFSKNEFNIFIMLAQNPDTIFSSEDLLQQMYLKEQKYPQIAVKGKIENINKKLKENSINLSIRGDYKKGYKLTTSKKA